jgi:hypothetical protein
VDGTDIEESPHSPFEVEPSSLHAPFCVPVEIPKTMYAGFAYSFLIQGRDEYHNNIADVLADAVGIDYSIVYSLISDGTVTVEA